MTGKVLSVVLASDHAGVETRKGIGRELLAWGFGVEDLGPETADPVDYPEYAEAVAERISRGDARFGVLVCGTGIGMSIAANRFPGVRAALLYDEFAARHARRHNDANVAVFGSRTMTLAEAVSRLRIFLAEPFEGGRHAVRLEKIRRMEKQMGREA
ncbi:MAG TPA: ribose 5-phosphate isomerase B [Candidatus Deferrimicrobiaceae bacterium]|nr:ribose 5-phosphate isomerase B [Candidatus Deferrimicrobiaceae bacterium]